MSELLPASGICTGGVATNLVEFTALKVATASAATAAASLATATGSAAILLTAITTQIALSNRGIAVGVKSVTAGQSVAINNAVLTRRNELAGPTNQFPVPQVPTGI